eukprot:SAG25_NODE_180_length_12624_cov_23.832495_1_plen_209_part_00
MWCRRCPPRPASPSHTNSKRYRCTSVSLVRRTGLLTASPCSVGKHGHCLSVCLSPSLCMLAVCCLAKRDLGRLAPRTVHRRRGRRGRPPSPVQAVHLGRIFDRAGALLGAVVPARGAGASAGRRGTLHLPCHLRPLTAEVHLQEGRGGVRIGLGDHPSHFEGLRHEGCHRDQDHHRHRIRSALPAWWPPCLCRKVANSRLLAAVCGVA